MKNLFKSASIIAAGAFTQDNVQQLVKKLKISENHEKSDLKAYLYSAAGALGPRK